MTTNKNSLHLHIDNASALGEIFEITQERFDAAAARHPEVASRLNVTFGQDGSGFETALQTANVVFAWNFDREELHSRAPNLELIQIQGAGINHLLPIDWVPPGVVLTNSSGAHGLRAGEYLIMAILALNCALPSMVTAQRHAQWKPIHNSSIHGKTLLIYGVGAIGGSCAILAKKLGMRVVGVRRSGSPHQDVDQMVTPDKLHDLLPLADFIAVTAPHTQETDRAFGVREFSLMKEGAGFVGYSRPNLVDYDALCERLKANTMSAILDVFEEEPLPESSHLWQVPNLIITPHSSSNDPDNHSPRSLDILFENIGRLIEGKEFSNVVDPNLQY